MSDRLSVPKPIVSAWIIAVVRDISDNGKSSDVLYESKIYGKIIKRTSLMNYLKGITEKKENIPRE